MRYPPIVPVSLLHLIWMFTFNIINCSIQVIRYHHIIITTRNSILFQPALKRLPRYSKHPSDLGPRKLQSPRTLYVIFAYIKLWSSGGGGGGGGVKMMQERQSPPPPHTHTPHPLNTALTTFGCCPNRSAIHTTLPWSYMLKL